MTERARYLVVQIVTAIRVPGALLAIPFVLDGNWIAVLAIYAVCEITDVLDGYLARRFQQVSPFGKLFDPYCDSVYRLSVFFSLAMADIFPYAVVWVMALRDVTVSYGRMAALARGQILSARSSGKIKAIVQAVASLGVVFIRAIELDEGFVTTATHAAAYTVIAITLWSMVDYGFAVVRMQRTVDE